MPDTQTSPNMNIVVPIPLVRVGPTWASDVQTALYTVIDAHDHSAGKGVKVPSAGLNINADLSFGGFNATAFRSTRYSAQGAALVGGSDLGCLYAVTGTVGGVTYNGDAFWNNGAGAAIPITKSGAIAPAPAFNEKGLSGSPYAIPATENVTIYTFAPASVTSITLPQISAVPAGRTYVLVDASGTSEANPVSLTPNGTDVINGVNAAFTLSANFGQWLVMSDGSHWFVQPLRQWYQPWQGSRNTQQGVLQWIPIQKTTTSTSAQTVLTYAVPTNSSVTFVVLLNVRQNVGSPATTGAFLVGVAVNDSGAVAVANAAATTATSGTSPYTSVAVVASGTNALVQVTAAAVTSTDWEGVILVIGN